MFHRNVCSNQMRRYSLRFTGEGEETMVKINILIIGDHGLVMDSIRQLLEREPDLEVVGAVFSPAELEKEIAHFQPDIIVIDAPSQRQNNLIWTKNISSRFPASKVVMLSGDASAEYVHASMRQAPMLLYPNAILPKH